MDDGLTTMERMQRDRIGRLAEGTRKPMDDQRAIGRQPTPSFTDHIKAIVVAWGISGFGAVYLGVVAYEFQAPLYAIFYGLPYGVK